MLCSCSIWPWLISIPILIFIVFQISLYCGFSSFEVSECPDVFIPFQKYIFFLFCQCRSFDFIHHVDEHVFRPVSFYMTAWIFSLAIIFLLFIFALFTFSFSCLHLFLTSLCNVLILCLIIYCIIFIVSNISSVIHFSHRYISLRWSPLLMLLKLILKWISLHI